jgi:enamine deaminase RidA (YjgF/YER057c/UK114 family)
VSAPEVVVGGWPTPKGYANGRVGDGRVLHVGGQIGCDVEGNFPKRKLFEAKFPAQFAQALDNVIAVVRAAGGEPTDIASMTVFVTHMKLYRASRKALAEIWKERLGRHYPAMALVAVQALYELEALVEIQAIAHLGAASMGATSTGATSTGAR